MQTNVQFIIYMLTSTSYTIHLPLHTSQDKPYNVPHNNQPEKIIHSSPGHKNPHLYILIHRYEKVCKLVAGFQKVMPWNN